MILDGLMCKYGRTDVACWESVATFSSDDGQIKNLPFEVTYEYYIVDSKTKRSEAERTSFGARRKFRI